MERAKKVSSLAVVLFQLGGPDSLDAVEPFLFNLFSDPDIIDFPFARLARPTMARLISSRRARHVREHYAAIGGKSPIGELTELQARALERELREARGLDARVFVALRYWHPLTEQAVGQVGGGEFRAAVLLPLYPQYSRTTTGSSLNEWQRRFQAVGRNHLPTKVVHAFYDHPVYLDAVVEKINEGLARFTGARTTPEERLIGRPAGASLHDVTLVFSAHGVPVRVIETGDPYQRQIEETVRLVMERGGWPNPHALCYQSRVNPGKWLEPSLSGTLRDLAASGVKRVLVVPVSFVCDHVETLAEINIEARKLAAILGIEQFELMPALNDSPTFIGGLADLVVAQIDDRTFPEDQEDTLTAEARKTQR